MEYDFSKNQVFCLKDSILSAIFEEGGVVFDLDSRVCHELNPTGARVLSLLDGRRSMDDVVTDLVKMLDESEATIRNDTEVFLKDLMGRGWVNVSHE